MKKLLLIFLYVLPILAISQYSPQQIRQRVNPKYSFGYVEGVRIDSINVKYAQIEFRNGNVIFKTDENSGSLRDKDDNLIYFSSHISSILNFLDYNGWEYVDVLKMSPEEPIILFKKKVSLNNDSK